jgi:DNA invertase Pin-like site-specific DNA recombinase
LTNSALRIKLFAMASYRKRVGVRGNRAALYIRVSTGRQATEGVSLDGQEQALRSYCSHRGLEVVEVVRDPAQSAFKPLAAREGGRRVLELARRREVDAVCVFKLDRAFRNAGDCLSVVAGWDKAGIALHLSDMGGQALDTSTAIGKMFLTMMAGYAEFERSQTSERTTMALGSKVARGDMRIGADAPYGWAYSGTALVEVPAEQAVIALARELRASGVSFRKLCERLTELGHANRFGRPFNVATLDKMLKGPLRLQEAVS